MIPLKPRPNHAATANNPASFRVSRNPIIAVIWQAEPARIVLGPPILSATKPQNWRLTNAQPSSTESIAAPCDGAIPTSPQNATRWPCGIAIGTQHKKPAVHNAPNTSAGRSPSTWACDFEPWRWRPGGWATSGALVKVSAAAGATSANCSAAKPTIVSRQPICASTTTKIGAQIAADTDDPLPSK